MHGMSHGFTLRLVPSEEIPGFSNFFKNKFRRFEPEKNPGPVNEPASEYLECEESIDESLSDVSLSDLSDTVSVASDVAETGSIIEATEVVAVSTDIELSALSTLWVPGLGEAVMLALMVGHCGFAEWLGPHISDRAIHSVGLSKALRRCQGTTSY